MSVSEIITDGGRRRHWSTPEKLRIVEETLDGRESISGSGKSSLAFGTLPRTNGAVTSRHINGALSLNSEI